MTNFEDLGFSKVDYDREERTGFPEIVYGLSKTSEQLKKIVEKLVSNHNKTLVTRISKEKATDVMASVPGGDYCARSQTLVYGENEPLDEGYVLIACAGTSDLPVADEAARTCKWMGCRVKTLYDVGVAGIDRLLAHRELIQGASVVIVIAGMEGALASVVGGLVKRPVIAVPTSVGYGTNLEGLTPLLAMLNSCSSGMSVVNIDNGFGGAYQATLIMKLAVDGGHPN
ncbi:nickel pincer cofactor biosynthesis protein LarB [Salicibibacter cibi]|uniref:Nickel pincer cofactor biosynthesis protein LarB n=1 Tax=Salicibibacter cibi TaxID=2743001 RepID=A0A7T6Z8R6_9BACI|nr:nickel pincer cofactor biosynthesis protein LarB [Salicibibacter cibi]QQK78906.1 nickel pincer cofactor biosynthesis protein LarB [Salicibibacter cibi]